MRSSAPQHSLARRWAAAATAASLVIVGLLGVTPAAADELAPEPPVVEQIVEPTPEPAVEPAPEPEPEPEPAPEPAPSETPAAEPTPEPTDEPADEAAGASRGAAPEESLSALAAVTPTVTVTPNTDVDVTVENTFTIEGTGFEGPGAQFGAYVLIGPAGNWAEGTPLSFAGWLTYAHVPAASVTDGAFTTTLTIAANTLTEGSDYIVATSAAHGLSATDRTMDTRTPFTTADPVVAPPATPTANITVTPATGLADEATVTISGDFPATVLQDLGPNAGSTATTGVYLMYCVQPSGAAGTSAGRASGAACDSTRQQYLASASGPAGATVVGTVSNGRWTFSQTMNVTDAFGAKVCLNAASGTDQCGVFVRLYHGFSATPGQNPANLANPYVYDQFVPVTFAAPTPPAGITVTPTSNLADEATVTVTGSFPATVMQDLGPNVGSASTTGVYVMYCVQPAGTVGTSGGRASGTNCDSSRQAYISAAAGPQGATTVGSVSNGTWSFSQTVTVTDAFGSGVNAKACLAAASGTDQCGIFVRLYHGFSATPGQNPANLANPYVYDQFVPVTFAAPTTPGGPTGPTNPTNPTNPAGASPSLSVTPNAVNPAVANTFTISGSGYTGDGAANGVYVNIGASSVWQPGQVPSTGGWLGSKHVPASSVVNGSFSTTITIPANTFVAGQSYGAATFAAHGLSITNRTLDRWASISLTTASTASTTSGTGTPADTPPATTGAEPADGAGDPKEGEEYTVTAGGFQPNEKGVLVVIYSTPTLLGTVDADASGVVTWTGILPRGLSGKHTFTFQGSVDRGVVLDIAAADVIGCPVDDATLEWGFKETFRSYISGSIANGEWVVADGATYETPSFGWLDGTGGYDAEAGEGDVGYVGSITFTGHGGILNTTVANPRIVFDGIGTATLLLDISGTTQEGEPVNSLGVEFATLDVSGAVAEDGTFTVTDAPATLTADGAAAFGTYPEGEELDPVSFGFTLAADCSDAVAAPGDTVDGENTSASSPNLWWVWLLGGIVLVAIIAAIILLLRRRAQA